MLTTTAGIMQSLNEYASPHAKLNRLVKEGYYRQIMRGLYCTGERPFTEVIASNMVTPSYLSFDFALSFHGVIPEYAPVRTSATVNKSNSKSFTNEFGRFEYSDVPEDVYHIGIYMVDTGNGVYWMATPEKALCDKLYSIEPVARSDIESLLICDLRADTYEMSKMDGELIHCISEHYHCRNVSHFDEWFKGWDKKW